MASRSRRHPGRAGVAVPAPTGRRDAELADTLAARAGMPSSRGRPTSMRVVEEHLAWWPKIDDVIVIERDETLILQGPWSRGIAPMPVGKPGASGPPAGPDGAGRAGA